MHYAELVVGAVIGAAVAISVVLVAGWLNFTADFALGVTTGIVSSAVVALLLGIIRAPHLVLDVAEHAEATIPRDIFVSSMSASEISNYASAAGNSGAPPLSVAPKFHSATSEPMFPILA